MAAGIDLEYDTAALVIGITAGIRTGAAVPGGAIEISLSVPNQTATWMTSVGSAGECIEHGVMALRAYLENGSAPD